MDLLIMCFARGLWICFVNFSFLLLGFNTYFATLHVLHLVTLMELNLVIPNVFYLGWRQQT